MILKTYDDYKMLITNSAMIINNYEAGACPTLERTFMIWDPVYHRNNIIGMYYDKEKKKLYLPRGSDIYYVKRKLQSTLEDELTSTIIRPYKYGYTSKINLMKYPRNQRQIEAMEFILCKNKYSINSNKTQLSVNLSTGVGKTYCAVGAISYLGIRTMIITTQSGILEQWRIRLKEYTDIKDNEIVMLEGGHMLDNILEDKSSKMGKSVYLITHSTLQSYGTTRGWDKVGEVFEKLGIGIKIYDEAHQNFANMAMIDFFTNVWRTYYLTATPQRSDRQEDKIYQIYMKNVPGIELFDEEEDPHTGYISIKYNSCPKPSDITACKSTQYGLNLMAYVSYLTRNDRFWMMFDYIFSVIYKSGGKALFYIATNDAISKVRDHILYNYPELYNDIGTYSSISDDKAIDKTKKYILTTTKSAGAGEDIPHLKYSVVLAEPFKSPVQARQTLGRTRDNNTTYIELVDVGFKQLLNFYNAKKPIFTKYASYTKVVSVDNVKLVNFYEESRLRLANRFKIPIKNASLPIDGLKFGKPGMKVPGIIFISPTMNTKLNE